MLTGYRMYLDFGLDDLMEPAGYEGVVIVNGRAKISDQAAAAAAPKPQPATELLLLGLRLATNDRRALTLVHRGYNWPSAIPVAPSLGS